MYSSLMFTFKGHTPLHIVITECIHVLNVMWYNAHMDISIKERMPFIIPFKETSVRCSGKNFKLYKYTIEWLVRNGVKCEDVYVVSKSEAVREFIGSEGEKTGYYVNFVREHEEAASEVEASYICAKSIGASVYMVIALTSPVRTDGLIDRMVAGITAECDFVTTCRYITDRSIFLLDDSGSCFIHSSDERKGSMCRDMTMIDGSAYLVKTKFMDRIMSEEGSLNNKFWHGNFVTVHNDTDWFFDIDTEDDMRRFEMYTRLINHRKRLVVVGNLIDGVDRSAEINGFDYVIRGNRMNNFGSTGTKTNLLMVDPHNEFWRLADIPEYASICRTYVKSIIVSGFFNPNDIRIKTIFGQRLINTRRILNTIEYSTGRHSEFNSNAWPTTTFCLVDYAIDMFSEDYDIFVSNENRRRFIGGESKHGMAAESQLKIYNDWERNGTITFLN